MMFNFVPRLPALLALEGKYEGFEFSCRHRDILRCSITRHFRSCYSPDGIFSSEPKKTCCRPDVAILFERDRSGQFLWRAFVKMIDGKLLVGKFYGNPNIDVQSIIRKGVLLNLKFLDLDLTEL